MDRQDIDALLIGALYGELTPADEARLAAHLDSHPTDRGALDDLKSARHAVRESRIFELQADPPQAVSALLLQEAHRRAPKRAVVSEEKESWFYRFTKMFLAHPAMAAAAMLVLVVGVASMIYVKKGDSQFANKEVAAPVGAGESANTTPTPPVADPATATPPQRDDNAEFQLNEGESAVAHGSAYSVDIDDKSIRDRAAKLDRSEGTKQEQAKASDREDGLAKNKKTASNTIILDRPKPEPKDLAEPRAKAVTEKGAAKAGKSDDGFGYDESRSGAVGGDTGGGRFSSAPSAASTGAAAPGPSGGGGATGAAQPGGRTVTVAGSTNRNGPTQSAPSPPPPPANASPAPASPPASIAQQPSTKPTSPATTTKPPATTAPAKTPAPAPAPAKKVAKEEKPPAEKPADSAPAKDAAKDANLLAWAKQQHNLAQSRASNGDCAGAAKLAILIQNRAPEFYTQYVATDRQLKKCQAYIAAERDADAEKSAKSRAQKRVNADEPASVK